MTDPPLPAAHQDRSRLTRDRLVTAGLAVLERSGPAGLTIAAVSAEAGVAGGSVYRRFGGKDGLLFALQHEFTTGFGQEFSSRMEAATGRSHSAADGTLADAVDRAVHALSGTFRTHEVLMRMFAELGLKNEQIMAEGRTASQGGGESFGQMLRLHGAELNAPDSEVRIDMAYRLVYASCMHRVLNGPNLESPTDLSWDALADELSAAVTAYLTRPTIQM